MNKGKLLLAAIGCFAIVGGALAFKTSRIDQKLYYLTTLTRPNTTITYSTCIAQPFLTTTNTTVGTVAPPVGAAAWYTTSLCNAQTFRAVTSED